jgi:Flp pilus assembly protein TadG
VRNRIASLRNEDGQALVELALVIPLLLIVLFGIIDFGLALNQYNDTTNLANLGARAAAVAPDTTSTTTTNPTCVNGSVTSTTLTSYLKCEGALDSAALGAVSVTVADTSPGCAGGGSTSGWATGDTIQVTVNDTFSWFQILVGGVGRLGGSVPSATSTISSTATMREEANNTTVPTWVASGATSIC